MMVNSASLFVRFSACSSFVNTAVRYTELEMIAPIRLTALVVLVLGLDQCGRVDILRVGYRLLGLIGPGLGAGLVARRQA